MLQYEYLKSINQLALAIMRQMNQDGSHGQQETAELLSGVNAANFQFVLTEVALKTSWEAEPNEDERERHQNAFRHARSVLQAMKADRGRAGAQALTAEQALDADQRANPENPTAALADDFAARSSEYDLRNHMFEEFVESKQEITPPRKKAIKKTRTPAERAAAKAAKQVAEMEAAAIAAEAATYETADNEHAAE